MIYTSLIKHKWRETKRSSVFDKNLAVKILMGFFILYFLANFILLGLFADKILLEAFPESNPVDIFNGFILYYFCIELVIRFLMQDIPVMSIQPYYHLPVKRSSLFHFILARALTSLFNIVPLILFIPFGLKTIPEYYPDGSFVTWILGIFFIMLTSNYFIFWVKKQTNSRPWMSFVFIACIGGLIALDHYNIFDFSTISMNLFNSFITNPVAFLVPLLLAAGLYFLNFRYLQSKVYPEEMKTRQSSKTIAEGDISFLKRFDQLGDLIALEIKMLLRHKRTKGVLIMTPLMVFYGLIFYPQEAYQEMSGMLIFVGIFISGMFTLSYGQFMSGWEAAHFDRLLSTNISTYNYYMAKLWLFWVISTIMFALSIPYFYFGWKIVFVNFMAYLFNLGITPLIIFIFSLYNYKKIDLAGSAAFNWQGVSGKNFVMMIPVLVLPMLIYGLFKLFGVAEYGLYAVGALGVLGVVFTKYWLNQIVKAFHKKKYVIASGFRENE